jgi:hypothetical protein
MATAMVGATPALEKKGNLATRTRTLTMLNAAMVLVKVKTTKKTGEAFPWIRKRARLCRRRTNLSQSSLDQGNGRGQGAMESGGRGKGKGGSRVNGKFRTREGSGKGRRGYRPH